MAFRRDAIRIDEIQARHFFQTREAAGLPRSLVRSAAEDVAMCTEGALASLEAGLPPGFSVALQDSVLAGLGV